MTKDALRQLIANVKATLRVQHYTAVLKYDRNQPRGPKGTRTGGRWVKSVSAGAHDKESFSPVPGMGKDRGPADYADILNAPSGTGFRNAPRQVGQVRADVSLAHAAATSHQREQEAQELAQAEQARSHTLDLMTNAVPLESRPLGGGANASVVVTLEYSKAENDWQGTEAVYKPERGENWTASFCNDDITSYVTNRDFSLAAREAFAYQVGHELFGKDNPVPITTLREVVDESNIDVPQGESEYGEGGYDSGDLRERYDSYREKRQEEAMDEVGGEMADLFQDAQKEHVEDIENRIEEMQEIWDEEREKFPADVTEYGSQSALRRHPVLAMGPEGFERRADRGELDPLAVLDEAGVNVSSRMSPDEKNRVREVIQEKLQAGYREVGELDTDAAEEHLDRDDWIQDHENTEGRLIEEKIKTFDSWRQSMGFGSGVSRGSGGPSNADAPHPRGGSFQHFRDASSYGDMNIEDGARMAVLDYVIGTMDRHGGNIMYDEKTGKPLAIDNGYSMPASRTPDGFQFRSEAVDEWMSGDTDSTNVPENVRVEVSKQLETTNWQALLDRHPGMNALERKAFLGRVEIARRSLQTPEGMYNLWDRLNRM